MRAPPAALHLLLGLLAGAASALPVTAPAAPLPVTGRAPVTVPVTVTNPGPADVRETLGLDLPPGWSLLLGDLSFTVPAGGTHVELLTLVPPALAPAGTVELPVRTSDASAVARLDVAAVRRVQAVATEVPPFDALGGHTVVWRVSNAGNTTEVLSLALGMNGGARGTLDTDALTLAPGEARTVRASIDTRGLKVSGPFTSRLEVRLRNGPTLFGVARTDVVVANPSLDARYHTFPVVATFAAVLNGSGGAATVALGGTGRLVRGDPGVSTFSLGPDGAFVGYARPEYAWSAGRIDAGLSPLVPHSTVLGAQGALLREGLGGRAFAGVRADGALEAGAAVGFRNDRLQGWAGLQSGADGTFAAAGGQYAAPDLEVAADAAADLTRGAAAATAQGTLRSGKSRFGMSAAAVTAGWTGAGSPDARLGVQWSGPLGTVGPTAFEGRARADVRVGTDVAAAASLGVTARAAFGTVNADATVSTEAGALRVGLDTKVGDIALNQAASAVVRFGGPTVVQYDATARFPGAGDALRVAVGARASTDGSAPRVSLELNGAFAPRPDLKLAYALGTPDLTAGAFSGGLEAFYTATPATTLALGATVDEAGGRWRAALRLSGRIALDVPVHERRDVAHLAGRVTDPDGRGLSGLLLRAGPAVAVTDDEGRFSFVGLPVGPTTLESAGDAALADLLFDPPLPTSLDLRAGESREFAVRSVRAARVRVAVRVETPAPAPDLLFPTLPPVTRLVFVLTGADGRTWTGAPRDDGSFDLGGLPAGTYSLRPDGATAAALREADVLLPDTVTLAAGGVAELSVTLRPRPRRIEIEEPQDLTPGRP